MLTMLRTKALAADITAAKARGNHLYKSGEFAAAAVAYAEGIALSTAASVDLKTWPAVELAVIACQSNQALMYVKLGRHAAALDVCDAAMAAPAVSANPGLHGKLLERRVLALEGLRRYAEAVNALLDIPRRGRDGSGGGSGSGSLEAIAERLDAALSGGADSVVEQLRTLSSAAPSHPAMIQEQLGGLLALGQQWDKSPAEWTTVVENVSRWVVDHPGHVDAEDPMGNTLLQGCALLLSESSAAVRVFFGGDGDEEGAASAGRRRSPFEELLHMLVVDHGANPNQRSTMSAAREGEPGCVTPLMGCAKGANPHGIRLLLGLGADPTLRDETGCTPLFIACLHGISTETSLIQGMREESVGAGSDTQDPVGAVRAFTEGCGRIAEYINFRIGDNGSTALHICASEGFPRRAELLLEAGARIDIANRYALTPLALVVKRRLGVSAPSQDREPAWGVIAAIDRAYRVKAGGCGGGDASGSGGGVGIPSLSSTDPFVRVERYGTFINQVMQAHTAMALTPEESHPQNSIPALWQEAAQARHLLLAITQCSGIQAGLMPAQHSIDLVAWQNACAACGAKPGTLKCGKCGIARYCSRECQKSDWKETFKVVKGVRRGRGHKTRCAWIADQKRLGLWGDRANINASTTECKHASVSTNAKCSSGAVHDDQKAEERAGGINTAAAGFTPSDNILLTLSDAVSNMISPLLKRRWVGGSASDIADQLGQLSPEERAELAVYHWQEFRGDDAHWNDPIQLRDHMFRQLVEHKTVWVNKMIFDDDGLVEGKINRSWFCLIAGYINHTFAFAVPSDEALAALGELGPLIEMGAGSGYWAWVLRNRGADILAYDIEPASESCDNMFILSSFTEVLPGTSASVLAGGKNAERALFICWPWSTELEKLPKYEVWDEDCLKAYSGSTVAYVGAMNIGPHAAEGWSGMTSSLAFQKFLLAHFDLQQKIALPHFGDVKLYDNDLFVYTRKT